MREWTGGRGVRVEDELFDGHNLLAVAEFFQLAQQGLDVVYQHFALGTFQLAEYFLCGGLASHRHWGNKCNLTDNVVSVLVTHQAKQGALAAIIG